MEVISFCTKEKLNGMPVSIIREFEKDTGCTDVDIVADESMIYIPMDGGGMVFCKAGDPVRMGVMFRTLDGTLVMHHPRNAGLIVPVLNKKLIKTFKKEEKEFGEVTEKFQELLKFAQDNKIRVRLFTSIGTSGTWIEKKSTLNKIGCSDVFDLLRSTETINDDGYIVKTDTVPTVNWLSIELLEGAEKVMKE